MSEQQNQPPHAIITGGVRGLGRAMVERFLEAGYAVSTCSTSAKSGGPLIEEVRQAHPAKPLFYQPADMGDAEQLEAFYAAAVERFGPPKVLVNNAAAVIFKHVAEATPEDVEQTLRVNFMGYWRLARNAYGHMKAAGGGSIVNLSSTHPYCTKPNSFPYNASKGGVLAMTRAMAVDFGPDNVRVNAVLPGFVLTRPSEDWINSLPDPAAKWEQVKAGHPLRRLPSERDVAESVYFLASDLAAGITGVDLVVDAGRDAMRAG